MIKNKGYENPIITYLNIEEINFKMLFDSDLELRKNDIVNRRAIEFENLINSMSYNKMLIAVGDCLEEDIKFISPNMIIINEGSMFRYDLEYLAHIFLERTNLLKVA